MGRGINFMVLAQASTSLGTIGGAGLGPWGTIGQSSDPTGATAVVDTISSIIGIMTTAASIWFLLQILFGGYEWMSAGGDSKKIETARSRITNAFIGLIIVVGSWSLLAVTGKFLGFDTLVNPATFLQSVKIGN
jgi:hypothetical protein